MLCTAITDSMRASLEKVHVQKEASLCCTKCRKVQQHLDMMCVEEIDAIRSNSSNLRFFLSETHFDGVIFHAVFN